MDNEVRASFFIPGMLPGWNEAFAAANANRYKGNTLKKQWTNDIALIVKSHHFKPMDQAYFIFTWYEKDRRRNPDNIAAGGRKLILDSLQVAGVIENDGWHQVLGWEDKFLVDKPGVHVQIRGLMR